MKRFFKLMIFAIPILGLGLSSCYPEFDATVNELDLAITKYDKGQDFMELQTFYMEDTVMYIGEEVVVPHAHKYDDHIIKEVRDNLLRLGWVEVTDTTDMENKPDVMVFLSALETDVYYYYWYWWDYWWWYPWDWWYPIYPGYPIYPIYPGGGSVYGYSVGTVLVDMMPNRGFDNVENPENPIVKPPIAWTGAINGILSGSEENMTGRISTQFRQVFDQSEYLIKKEPR